LQSAWILGSQCNYIFNFGRSQISFDLDQH
jgi:hypothetical protein